MPVLHAPDTAHIRTTYIRTVYYDGLQQLHTIQIDGSIEYFGYFGEVWIRQRDIYINITSTDYYAMQSLLCPVYSRLSLTLAFNALT